MSTLAWLALRLIKFLGVTAFSGGLIVATTARSGDDRLRAAWTLAPAGFALSWFAGWGLLKATNVPISSPWVLAAMLLSFSALHLALLATAPRRSPRALAVLTWAMLAGTVGAMVGRTSADAWWAAGGIAAVVGGLAARLLVSDDAPTPALDAAAYSVRAFRRWSWIEGASTIFLLLVFTPLKRGAGINLDAGTGLAGWTHGVLTLVYLNALARVARVANWRARDIALAVVASAIPFGFLAVRKEPGEAPRATG